MTVKELINELKKYPDDMIVGVSEVHRDRKTNKPVSDIDLQIAHWEHTNYPYDLEDFDYLRIE